MIMAAQDPAIRTRWVQKNFDKMDITETCRMCQGRSQWGGQGAERPQETICRKILLSCRNFCDLND